MKYLLIAYRLINIYTKTFKISSCVSELQQDKGSDIFSQSAFDTVQKCCNTIEENSSIFSKIQIV